MKENKLLFGYMLFAYIFVFVFHLYWLYWAKDISEFYWHGQLMINNVDGYFFGSGAQRILDNLHLDNPRLDGIGQYGVAVITAYVSKFFHISIDSVMLYMPAVVSSLVIIPIILIGKLYDNIKWGFLSAIIGGIVWSYYNRTLIGYYDTDMFSAMMPMLILYFMLVAIKNNSLIFSLLASISIAIYPWLYDQGLSIIYAIGIISFIYLVLLKFKEEFSYKFIIILSIGLLPIPFLIKLILIIVAYIIFNKNILKLELKFLQIIASLFVVIFLYEGNLVNIILSKVLSYSTSTTSYEALKFLNVNRTVSEAGHIPWYIVFDRIIGSSIGIVFAVLGYILLVKKHKEFIIALPLWGIGFFAFVGGLRFTVYAVPIASISGVYFFVWLSSVVKKEKLQIMLPIMGSVFLIIPNITHIVGCCEKNSLLDSIKKFYPLKTYPYLVPTTFKKSEVKVLDELNKKSNDKDYVITWWDYGYPIWYYADVNTLIDGGKHNEDNFIVSKILTSSNPYLVANLSKISIDKYVKTKTVVATQLFIKNSKPIDVNNYLDKIGNKNYKAPKLDRDIFLMFPYRMFNILPTVSAFSNRNLNNGNKYQSHFFYKGRVRNNGKYIMIGNMALDIKHAFILANNTQIPIKEINIVGYNHNRKLYVQKQNFREEGLRIIILKSYGEALIVDDYYYNSSFIQMFVFENYDKNLFEPVILNPFMKVYKIK